MAAAGAVGAFVVGISAQAVRGHATPAAGDTSSAAVRAAISDTISVTAPAGAPSLRTVAIPALRSAPKPRRKARPEPDTSVLVVAEPTPAPAPAPAVTPVPTAAAPAPAPVVTSPPPAPVKAAPKPSAPARGPGFDSSG